MFSQTSNKSHPKKDGNSGKSSLQHNLSYAYDNITNLPKYGATKFWDLSTLTNDCLILKQKCDKIKIIHKKYPKQKRTLLNFFLNTNIRKKVDKANNLYNSILPQLRVTENELKLWLEAIQNKRKKVLSHGCMLLSQIEVCCDYIVTQKDTLDEVRNEILVILEKLQKEQSSLKLMLEVFKDFERQIVAESRKSSLISNLDETVEHKPAHKVEVLAEARINENNISFSGYSGAAGRKLSLTPAPLESRSSKSKASSTGYYVELEDDLEDTVEDKLQHDDLYKTLVERYQNVINAESAINSLKFETEKLKFEETTCLGHLKSLKRELLPLCQSTQSPSSLSQSAESVMFSVKPATVAATNIPFSLSYFSLQTALSQGSNSLSHSNSSNISNTNNNNNSSNNHQQQKQQQQQQPMRPEVDLVGGYILANDIKALVNEEKQVLQQISKISVMKVELESAESLLNETRNTANNDDAYKSNVTVKEAIWELKCPEQNKTSRSNNNNNTNNVTNTGPPKLCCQQAWKKTFNYSLFSHSNAVHHHRTNSTTSSGRYYDYTININDSNNNSDEEVYYELATLLTANYYHHSNNQRSDNNLNSSNTSEQNGLPDDDDDDDQDDDDNVNNNNNNDKDNNNNNNNNATITNYNSYNDSNGMDFDLDVIPSLTLPPPSLASSPTPFPTPSPSTLLTTQSILRHELFFLDNPLINTAATENTTAITNHTKIFDMLNTASTSFDHQILLSEPTELLLPVSNSEIQESINNKVSTEIEVNLTKQAIQPNNDIFIQPPPSPPPPQSDLHTLSFLIKVIPSDEWNDLSEQVRSQSISITLSKYLNDLDEAKDTFLFPASSRDDHDKDVSDSMKMSPDKGATILKGSISLLNTSNNTGNNNNIKNNDSLLKLELVRSDSRNSNGNTTTNNNINNGEAIRKLSTISALSDTNYDYLPLDDPPLVNDQNNDCQCNCTTAASQEYSHPVLESNQIALLWDINHISDKHRRESLSSTFNNANNSVAAVVTNLSTATVNTCINTGINSTTMHLGRPGMVGVLAGSFVFETLFSAFGMRDELRVSDGIKLPVLVQMESSKEWVYISSYLEEQIYNEYLQYTEPSICRCHSINATTSSSTTTTTSCESNLPFVLPVQCIDQTKLNLSSYDLCKFICSWRCSGEIVRNGMKQFETLKGHNFGIFLKSMLMRIISTNNISAAESLIVSVAPQLIELSPDNISNAAPGKPHTSGKRRSSPLLTSSQNKLSTLSSRFNRTFQATPDNSASPSPPPASLQPASISANYTTPNSIHMNSNNNNANSLYGTQTPWQAIKSDVDFLISFALPAAANNNKLMDSDERRSSSSSSTELGLLVPLGALKILLCSTSEILTRLEDTREELVRWLDCAATLAHRFDLEAPTPTPPHSQTQPQPHSGELDVSSNSVSTTTPLTQIHQLYSSPSQYDFSQLNNHIEKKSSADVADILSDRQHTIIRSKPPPPPNGRLTSSRSADFSPLEILKYTDDTTAATPSPTAAAAASSPSLGSSMVFSVLKKKTTSLSLGSLSLSSTNTTTTATSSSKETNNGHTTLGNGGHISSSSSSSTTNPEALSLANSRINSLPRKLQATARSSLTSPKSVLGSQPSSRSLFGGSASTPVHRDSQTLQDTNISTTNYNNPIPINALQPATIWRSHPLLVLNKETVASRLKMLAVFQEFRIESNDGQQLLTSAIPTYSDAVKKSPHTEMRNSTSINNHNSNHHGRGTDDSYDKSLSRQKHKIQHQEKVNFYIFLLRDLCSLIPRQATQTATSAASNNNPHTPFGARKPSSFRSPVKSYFLNSNFNNIMNNTTTSSAAASRHPYFDFGFMESEYISHNAATTTSSNNSNSKLPSQAVQRKSNLHSMRLQSQTAASANIKISNKLTISTLLVILSLDSCWTTATLYRSIALALEALQQKPPIHYDSANSSAVSSPVVTALVNPSVTSPMTSSNSNPLLSLLQLPPRQRSSASFGAHQKNTSTTKVIKHDSDIEIAFQDMNTSNIITTPFLLGFDQCQLYNLHGGLLGDSVLLELSRQLPLPTSTYKPYLRYCSAEHGYSLSALLETCCCCDYHKNHRVLNANNTSNSTTQSLVSKSSYVSFLLLIKEVTGHVFGSYISEPIKEGGEIFGTEQSRVFIAYPNLKIFKPSGRSQPSSNNNYARCNRNGFSIGSDFLPTSVSSPPSSSSSPQSPQSSEYSLYNNSSSSNNNHHHNQYPTTPASAAISFDHNLNFGRSFPSLTYNNSQLSFRSHFKCQQLQIWTFESFYQREEFIL